MWEIIIIAIGKTKSEYYSGAIGEYLTRLKPYAAIKVLELTPEPFTDSNRAKAKQLEGERVVKVLEKYSDAEIFLMHERGREMDSLKFAKKLSGTNGKIVFVIAGALGFAEEILAKHQQLSLSKMTFPHEMARLILLEQIYRAATIARGKTYHY